MASWEGNILRYRGSMVGMYQPGHTQPNGNYPEIRFNSGMEELYIPQREEILAFLANFQDEQQLERLYLTMFDLGHYNEPTDQIVEQLGRDKWTYPFTYDFFPGDTTLYLKNNYLKLWCQEGLSPERIEQLSEIVYSELEDVDTWVRYLDLEREVQKDPDNFSLVFKYGPEACYPSKLPRTTMNQLHGGRTIGDIYLTPTNIDLPSGKFMYYTSADGQVYLPVIRYAASAHGTLYHGGTYSKKACGTFYYYESQGDSVLHTRTFLVKRNKYITLRDLIAELPEGDLRGMAREKLEELERDYGRVSLEHYSGLTKAPADAYIDRLYAKEDRLDRMVCLVGRELGYDTLIFTHMAGTRRFVTEVLDTRSREESIENLFALDY